MATINYKIEFTSFWHTGSGLSSGTESDLVVLKDKNGLPIIPGKTLKGLLREAAEIINHFDNKLVSREFIDVVFGETPDESKSGVPKEALSFFTDATLSEKIRKHLSENEDLKSLLFKNITSTRIDDKGQTVDQSLRQMEATIPLELYAQIIEFPSEYQGQIESCFAWVKKMGLNRSRGFGRCMLQTIKSDN